MTVRARAHVVLLALLLLTLFANLLLYGGLAQLPEGKAFLDSARRESPLALMYMTAGDPLIAATGLSGIGQDLARAAYGETFDAVEASPGAASDLIETGDFGEGHALARAIYWATPFLFVAWLIAYLLRPRAVHLVRRR